MKKIDPIILLICNPLTIFITVGKNAQIKELVNLVSKTPKEKRDLSFMLNGTSALGLDASGFYSQKFKKLGTYFFLCSLVDNI